MSALTSTKVRRVITTATPIAIAVFAAASLNVVRQGLGNTSLSLTLLLLLLPFGIWSYGLRSLRWFTLARSVIPNLSVVVATYSQIVGFAFSATPGRIAEVYKLKVLERSTGTPAAQTFPAMVVERITDAAAFAGILAIGGLFRLSTVSAGSSSRTLIVLAVLIVVLVAAYLFQLRRPDWLKSHLSVDVFLNSRLGRWVLRLPGGQKIAMLLAQFQEGGSKVLSPVPFIVGLALVTLGRVGDGIILWRISQAVGYPLPLPLALVIIGSSGLVGGATLAPGGIGITEATLIGLLVANGTPLNAAVIATFGTRILVFWLWVVLGLVVFALSQARRVLRSVPLRGSGQRAPQPPPANSTIR